MTKKYSFKELLTEEIEISDQKASTIKIDKIIIPKIQRDYAQGRKVCLNFDGPSELNISGRKFITEIFSTLVSSTKVLDLDFIYGSIVTEKHEGEVFYPLDGQQRLTTLFLLYWFIAGEELQSTQKEEISTMLKKFSYQTRTSSSKFCENLACELTKANIKFPQKIEKGEDHITSQIKNLAWFYNAYILDPTISAMLNMLEKIEELYLENNCQNVFANLEKLKFYILPLNNFGLTEELYVKMNARGKQLSDFENFKADFQEWIKTQKNLQDQIYDNRKMSYDMFVINKIDNEWSQCFWKMVSKSDDKNFDPIFLRFIYKYLFNEYTIKYNKNNRSLDKSDYFKLIINDSQYLGLSIFDEKFNETSLENLVTLLDNISEHYDDIISACQPSWSADPYNVIQDKLELKDRAIFYAMSTYFIKNKSKNYDFESFKNWMHAIWNIVENSDIDNYSMVAGVIKLIEEMSAWSYDIYSSLADDSIVFKSTQSKEIVSEERLKAELIQSDENWKEVLWEAEKHKFFRGNIGFLIPDNKNIDEFKQNFDMAKKLFDKDGVAEEYQKEHLLLRALISQYKALSNIKYQLTDRDEKEHSLKKMLLSDDVVKATIKGLISLRSESDIKQKLEEFVKQDSPIKTGKNDFEKRVHEKLYKEVELITWMQQQSAYKYQNYYVTKPHGVRIYLGGYINEIITKLLESGWFFANENRNVCYIDKTTKIPYYKFPGFIDIYKNQTINGKEYSLACHFEEQEITLSVDNQKTSFNYLDEVSDENKIDDFISKIKKEFSNLFVKNQ